jgi:hypothetical protein
MTPQKMAQISPNASLWTWTWTSIAAVLLSAAMDYISSRLFGTPSGEVALIFFGLLVGSLKAEGRQRSRAI